MDYYVYENWTRNKAYVHAATCGSCNHGRGMQAEDSGANGQWLGPYPDCATAMAAARILDRADTRTCAKCIAADASSDPSARRNPEEVVAGRHKVSDRVRALGRAGYSRSEIAKLVDRSYQQVRQVLVDEERRRARRGSNEQSSPGMREEAAAFLAPPMEPNLADRVLLDDEGRLCLTPDLIKALNARPGEYVIAVAGPDGTVALTSARTAMEQARAIIRAYVPEGVSLVEELLAERRAEAERENRSD